MNSINMNDLQEVREAAARTDNGHKEWTIIQSNRQA